VEYKHIPHEYFYLNGMIANGKARKIIKSLKPKTIYDLTGNITSASLIFNSKAKEIIGINKKSYKNIYTNFSIIRNKPHNVDIYLDAIKATIPINRKDILNLPYEIKKDGYILIHPFAGWKAKEWNLRKFLELGELINKKYSCLFIFLSNSISNDIAEELKRKNISFIETKTIKELIKVIKGSSVFIGNDSGPIHIANLLNKPTFTIYGPTNPEYHIPLSGVNEYIIHKLKCSPKPNEKVCFTNGGRFGCPSFECMNNLGVEEVMGKLKSFFKEINIKSI
jgi:heptosyltransferase-2